jgi:hypothetical protein
MGTINTNRCARYLALLRVMTIDLVTSMQYAYRAIIVINFMGIINTKRKFACHDKFT